MKTLVEFLRFIPTLVKHFMQRLTVIVLLLGVCSVSCACTTDGIYPDTSLECTPTSVYPVTKEEICVKGYSLTVRKTTQAMKNKVFELYGIPEEERKNFVLDHVISLQLGGRDDIDNLFPQNKNGEINSRTKDKIENFLKRSVCKDEITLKEAQEQIKEDWVAVLEDYLERNE